ncbi:hypothetical protein SLS62_007659 [Diatrype stigma]|uniref:Uncharacterized protein n=1 Tax=Diatrype stigma TaxID=117547 RepID=A0AAN9ULH5_9PEZI
MLYKRPRPDDDLERELAAIKRACETWSPLHYAIENWESTCVVDSLVNQFWDPTVQNEKGLTPLLRACQIGNFAGALELIEERGARVSLEELLEDEPKCPPLLHLAVQGRDNFKQDGRRILLERPGPVEARDAEQVAFIKFLLAKGVDVDELFLRNRNGHRGQCTPLNTAIGGIDSEGRGADTVPAVVEALLEAGADPNHPDESGSTPLFNAVRFCVADDCDLEVRRETWAVIRLLVKYGARLDVGTESGDSPLSIAAEAAQRMAARDSECHKLLSVAAAEAAEQA